MPINYKNDRRYAHLSSDQVMKHYEVEKELREAILQSKKENRAEVIMQAYDDLFLRVPWHPALTEKSGITSPELIKNRAEQFDFILDGHKQKILGIGCGHGELMIGLSKLGYDCFGIDISSVRIVKLKQIESEKLHFEQFEGSKLPFSNDTFESVVSMQLFEHLHPDDTSSHLDEVKRVLKPGGKYYLETPNKHVGPGDISKFFSDEPQGFHLKEYDILDLYYLFKASGFSKVAVILRKKRKINILIAIILEKIWLLLPRDRRRINTFGLHNPMVIGQK
ncbi:MAG: hypothetical protein CVU40_10080 [Chloroflexi bacterium HGW-Chloroflexi-2]|jgi:SAM-dependent methyltransferase|nr:MAG: hypothetical protein CVU40_10080 [Chloroflexi bacterium HGW-Chloroflexi-2]